jgi:hypothetical protein
MLHRENVFAHLSSQLLHLAGCFRPRIVDM